MITALEEPRAVERGRVHADQLDAVPALVVRLGLVPEQTARDHGHVVRRPSSDFAQLGQQVRGRLDAGRVVLVEHQEVWAAGRSARAARILTPGGLRSRAMIRHRPAPAARDRPAARAPPLPRARDAPRRADRGRRAHEETASPAPAAARGCAGSSPTRASTARAAAPYERHRLLALQLREQPELLAPPLRLLQVSPDRPLERCSCGHGDRADVSIDIDNPQVELEMDVHELTFADESFDAVLALHVLDAVADERDAPSPSSTACSGDGGRRDPPGADRRPGSPLRARASRAPASRPRSSPPPTSARRRSRGTG